MYQRKVFSELYRVLTLFMSTQVIITLPSLLFTYTRTIMIYIYSHSHPNWHQQCNVYMKHCLQLSVVSETESITCVTCEQINTHLLLHRTDGEFPMKGFIPLGLGILEKRNWTSEPALQRVIMYVISNHHINKYTLMKIRCPFLESSGLCESSRCSKLHGANDKAL